jgi:23S rRNA (adenine2503-C2)-methyltransferase
VADPSPDELLGLPLAVLATRLAAAIDRPYRARQVYDALYHRGLTDFAQMTDLPAELRSGLAERFRIAPPELVRYTEAADATRKFLLRLADGATVEAVDIPERRRRTLCLSSQAGCALACAFCVTGFWGAGRNLTAGEIVGQVLALRSGIVPPFEGLNLVFMGMGEPLHNLEALRQAIEVFAETISWRRITVSTAGVVPGIAELASWPKRPNLAVSLHAPDDERRSRLMPINRTHPLAELLAALADFPLERGRRLTIEYLLIAGFNDALADAEALSKRLRGLEAKINLIPINPDPVLGERMMPPEEAAVAAFQNRLRELGWIATVRRRRGDEVAGACGQLRNPESQPRGFRRSNLSF